MAKPRTATELQHDDEALRVRTNVIECLTEYVKESRNRAQRMNNGSGVVAAATAPSHEPRPLIQMENEL